MIWQILFYGVFRLHCADEFLHERIQKKIKKEQTLETREKTLEKLTQLQVFLWEKKHYNDFFNDDAQFLHSFNSNNLPKITLLWKKIVKILTFFHIQNGKKTFDELNEIFNIFFQDEDSVFFNSTKDFIEKLTSIQTKQKWRIIFFMIFEFINSENTAQIIKNKDPLKLIHLITIIDKQDFKLVCQICNNTYNKRFVSLIQSGLQEIINNMINQIKNKSNIQNIDEETYIKAMYQKINSNLNQHDLTDESIKNIYHTIKKQEQQNQQIEEEVPEQEIDRKKQIEEIWAYIAKKEQEKKESDAARDQRIEKQRLKKTKKAQKTAKKAQKTAKKAQKEVVKAQKAAKKIANLKNGYDLDLIMLDNNQSKERPPIENCHQALFNQLHVLNKKLSSIQKWQTNNNNKLQIIDYHLAEIQTLPKYSILCHTAIKLYNFFYYSSQWKENDQLIKFFEESTENKSEVFYQNTKNFIQILAEKNLFKKWMVEMFIIFDFLNPDNCFSIIQNDDELKIIHILHKMEQKDWHKTFDYVTPSSIKIAFSKMLIEELRSTTKFMMDDISKNNQKTEDYYIDNFYNNMRHILCLRSKKKEASFLFLGEKIADFPHLAKLRDIPQKLTTKDFTRQDNQNFQFDNNNINKNFQLDNNNIQLDNNNISSDSESDNDSIQSKQICPKVLPRLTTNNKKRNNKFFKFINKNANKKSKIILL